MPAVKRQLVQFQGNNVILEMGTFQNCCHCTSITSVFFYLTFENMNMEEQKDRVL